MANLRDHTEAVQDVPWPSDIELEIRGQLTELEQHQLRTDRLLTALQLEGRQLYREQTERIEAIGSKVDELVTLLRKLTSNGHGGSDV